MLEFFWRGRLGNVLGALFLILAILPGGTTLLVFYQYINPEALRENGQGLFISIMAGAATILLLFILFFLLVRNLTRTLEDLLNGIEQVGQGKAGVTVYSHSCLELDNLIKSFNTMSFCLSNTSQHMERAITRWEEQSRKDSQAHNELLKNNIDLRKLVMQDYLTGVFNRRYLIQQLRQQVELAIRYKQPMAVLFVDIDHFKKINDTYGHQAGDEVLKELVHVMKSTIRSTDILTRYGGEEFIVLAPQTDHASATLLAERIRQGIANKHFHTSKENIRFTVSLGVSSFKGKNQESGKIVEKLLFLADYRCHEAKIRGRNQVVTINLEDEDSMLATHNWQKRQNDDIL